MNLKAILGIATVLVIAGFVLFSLFWKNTESGEAVSYSQTKSVNTDIVDRNTDQMMRANAQAGDKVATGTAPRIDASRAPSEYVASGVKEKPQEKTPIREGRTYTVKQGVYFGCNTQYLLRRLVKYQAGYDDRFQKLLDKSTANGSCVVFRRGELVKVVEVNADDTESRVSRVGEDTTYWTVNEAIR